MAKTATGRQLNASCIVSEISAANDVTAGRVRETADGMVATIKIIVGVQTGTETAARR